MVSVSLYFCALLHRYASKGQRLLRLEVCLWPSQLPLCLLSLSVLSGLYLCLTSPRSLLRWAGIRCPPRYHCLRCFRAETGNITCFSPLMLWYRLGICCVSPVLTLPCV